MSDSGLEDKLRIAAAGWNPRHEIQPLIDAVWGLDKSVDVAGLAALTVTARVNGSNILPAIDGRHHHLGHLH